MTNTINTLAGIGLTALFGAWVFLLGRIADKRSWTIRKFIAIAVVPVIVVMLVLAVLTDLGVIQ